ncbi:MAG: SDR family oxidoreductase [Actinomycetota bacterium]|nr:SDR family oxidoreductase [Actinomycetota bacterium]
MGSKIAVVTGASAGVGRATAREFAKRGYDVGLIARDEQGLKGAVADVESAGGRAVSVVADVADFDQVRSAADQIEGTLGPIDVWVNNAMTSVFAEFKDTEPDEFKRVTEVTYLGVVYGTKVALERMLARDRGVIIQVGSALAYRGIPLQSAYCGSKHAIQGFTESLRCELLHDGSGVHISMVQMPALNTPQFDQVKSKLPRRAQPVPPIYQPEVAAHAIAWTAEHPRREVWVGGTTAATILANRLVPGLLDRYLARTGFDSQQMDEPEDPARPFNLWEPVVGDKSAHGDFDSKAHPRSFQLWAATHRWATLGGAALVGAAAAMWARSTARDE